MEMVEHNGFWWPANDQMCHPVIFGWQGDIDESLKHCRKFDVVVQAGGNVGVWPRRLSEVFKKVITFEPDADNFKCLLKNCKEVNIDKICAALGDKAGAAGLNRVPDNVGAHWIVEGDEFAVVTIDSLELPACDLIMLDIEGYELKALKGAVDTISRFKPVIVVEDKGLSNKYGSKQGDIEQWLNEEWGYEVVARPHRDVVLVA